MVLPFAFCAKLVSTETDASDHQGLHPHRRRWNDVARGQDPGRQGRRPGRGLRHRRRAQLGAGSGRSPRAGRPCSRSRCGGCRTTSSTSAPISAFPRPRRRPSRCRASRRATWRCSSSGWTPGRPRSSRSPISCFPAGRPPRRPPRRPGGVPASGAPSGVLARDQEVGAFTVRYLNRLSDALFVAARYENANRGVRRAAVGQQEVSEGPLGAGSSSERMRRPRRQNSRLKKCHSTLSSAFQGLAHDLFDRGDALADLLQAAAAQASSCRSGSPSGAARRRWRRRGSSRASRRRSPSPRRGRRGPCSRCCCSARSRGRGRASGCAPRARRSRR